VKLFRAGFEPLRRCTTSPGLERPEIDNLLGRCNPHAWLKSGAIQPSEIASVSPRRDFRPTGSWVPTRRFAHSRFASPSFIRIARFIDSVGRIDDVFGGTTELNESVGQKRFAIDPDPGFVGVKHYGDHFVAASQG